MMNKDNPNNKDNSPPKPSRSRGEPSRARAAPFPSRKLARASSRHFARTAVYLALTLVFNGAAMAAENLRLGVQKTGTFAWELALIKSRGLDAEAGLDIAITELASPEAAKIALIGGSVDMILSDWLWVARERNLGAKFVFAPYSSALGAVMVPAASPIHDLDDLRGVKIAVAGGPLDKSWLLLQALAQASNLDLKSQASIVYGAPALLYQKAVNGEADASLNFWTYCVALEAGGFRRLIGMDEVARRLGAKGPLAMVGYVFDESLAQKHAGALARFFALAREAKDDLAHSDAQWQKIARQIGVDNPAELALYRKTYVDGIPRRSIETEAADATALYRILAKIGGPELVGPATELDPATFYHGAALAAPGG